MQLQPLGDLARWSAAPRTPRESKGPAVSRLLGGGGAQGGDDLPRAVGVGRHPPQAPGQGQRHVHGVVLVEPVGRLGGEPRSRAAEPPGVGRCARRSSRPGMSATGVSDRRPVHEESVKGFAPRTMNLGASCGAAARTDRATPAPVVGFRTSSGGRLVQVLGSRRGGLDHPCDRRAGSRGGGDLRRCQLLERPAVDAPCPRRGARSRTLRPTITFAVGTGEQPRRPQGGGRRDRRHPERPRRGRPRHGRLRQAVPGGARGAGQLLQRATSSRPASRAAGASRSTRRRRSWSSRPRGRARCGPGEP